MHCAIDRVCEWEREWVCLRACMHGTTKQSSIGGPKPHRSLSAEPSLRACCVVWCGYGVLYVQGCQ